MQGISLDADELACLLRLMRADTVVGLESAPFWGDNPRASEALRRCGLRKLRTRRFVTPVPGKRQVHLHDDLACLVAMLVDPDLVVSTVYSASLTEQRLVLHYLAGGTLVELALATQQQYRFGVLPSAAALWDRIEGALHLPDAPDTAFAAEFALEPQDLAATQRLVADGATAEAEAALARHGVNGATSQSFLNALRGVVQGRLGMVVVARARGNQVLAERRVTVLSDGASAWLVHRPALERRALRIETVRRGTLATVVGGCLARLKQQGRPVPEPRSAPAALRHL